MRKLLLTVCALLAFSPAPRAVERQSYSQLKSDYSQVGAVARVKFATVEFAAPDVHPLYVVRGTVVEPYKGLFKQGQSIEFYFNAEEDYDVSRLAGGEWVVFLDAKFRNSVGRKVWVEMENSRRASTDELVILMKRIANPGKSNRRGQRRPTHAGPGAT